MISRSPNHTLNRYGGERNNPSPLTGVNEKREKDVKEKRSGETGRDRTGEMFPSPCENPRAESLSTEHSSQPGEKGLGTQHWVDLSPFPINTSLKGFETPGVKKYKELVSTPAVAGQDLLWFMEDPVENPTLKGTEMLEDVADVSLYNKDDVLKNEA